MAKTYSIDYQLRPTADGPLDSRSVISSIDKISYTTAYVGMIFSIKDNSSALYKVTSIDEDGYISSYSTFVDETEVASETTSVRAKVKSLDSLTTSNSSTLSTQEDELASIKEALNNMFRVTKIDSTTPSLNVNTYSTFSNTDDTTQRLPFNSNFFDFKTRINVTTPGNQYTAADRPEHTQLNLEVEVFPKNNITVYTDVSLQYSLDIEETLPQYGYTRKITGQNTKQTEKFSDILKSSTNFAYDSYLIQPSISQFENVNEYNKEHQTNISEYAFSLLTNDEKRILTRTQSGFKYVVNKGEKIDISGRNQSLTFKNVVNKLGKDINSLNIHDFGTSMNVGNQIIYGFIPKTGITISNADYMNGPTGQNAWAWEYPIIHHQENARQDTPRHIFTAKTYNDIFSLTEEDITYDSIVYVREGSDGHPCNTYYRVTNLNEPHDYCYIRQIPTLITQKIQEYKRDGDVYTLSSFKTDLKSVISTAYAYESGIFYDIYSQSPYKIINIDETANTVKLEKITYFSKGLNYSFTYNKTDGSNTVIASSVGDIIAYREGDSFNGYKYEFHKITTYNYEDDSSFKTQKIGTLEPNSSEYSELNTNDYTISLVGNYDTHKSYNVLRAKVNNKEMIIDVYKSGKTNILGQKGKVIITYSTSEEDPSKWKLYKVESLDRRHDIDLLINNNTLIGPEIEYLDGNDLENGNIELNYKTGYTQDNFYFYEKDGVIKAFKLKTPAQKEKINQTLNNFITVVIPEYWLKSDDSKGGVKWERKYTSQQYLEVLTTNWQAFYDEMLGCTTQRYAHENDTNYDTCLGISTDLKSKICLDKTNGAGDREADFEEFLFVDNQYTDFRIFTNFSEITESVNFNEDNNGIVSFAGQDITVLADKTELNTKFNNGSITDNQTLYYLKKENQYWYLKAKTPNIWYDNNGLTYVNLDENTINGSDAQVEDFANYPFDDKSNYVIKYDNKYYILSYSPIYSGKIREVELLNGNVNSIMGDARWFEGNSLCNCMYHVTEDYYEIGTPRAINIDSQSEVGNVQLWEFLLAGCLQDGKVLKEIDELGVPKYNNALMHYVVDPKGKFAINFPSDPENFLFFIAMPNEYGTINRGGNYYSSTYYSTQEDAEKAAWQSENFDYFLNNYMDVFPQVSKSGKEYNMYFYNKNNKENLTEQNALNYGTSRFFDFISSKYEKYDTFQMFAGLGGSVGDDEFTTTSRITTSYEYFDDTSKDTVSDKDARFTKGTVRADVAEFDSLRNMYINIPDDEFRTLGYYNDEKMVIDYIKYGKSLDIPANSSHNDAMAGWRYQLYEMKNPLDANKYIKNAADKYKLAATLVTPWLMEGEDATEIYVNPCSTITSMNELFGCGFFFNVKDTTKDLKDISAERAMELVNQEFNEYFREKTNYLEEGDPYNTGFLFYKGQHLFIFDKNDKYKIFEVVDGKGVILSTSDEFGFEEVTEVKEITEAENRIKGVIISGTSYNMTFANTIEFFKQKYTITNKNTIIINIATDLMELPRFAFANKIWDEESKSYKVMNKTINEIYLPYQINDLDRYCFAECRKATYMFVSTSVAYIPYGAYRNCFSLGRVSLTHSIDYVADNAFDGCSGLTEVYAANVDGDILDIQGKAFTNAGGSGGITSLYLTENVSAENNAFGHKNYIYATALGSYTLLEGPNEENITIDENTKIIDSNAFQGCNIVGTVNFDDLDKLVQIKHSAFEGCNQLKSVNFFKCGLLKSVGDYAFNNDVSLTTIQWHPSTKLTLGMFSFDNCNLQGTASSPFVIPATLIVNYSTFGHNNRLEYVKSLTSKIGGLNNCLSLTTVDLSELNEQILEFNSYAFANCSSLKEIKFKEKINYGTYGFKTQYTGPTPQIALKLRDGVFEGCTSMPVDLLQQCMYMGFEYDYMIPSFTFARCTQIESIKVPYDIREIGAGAFSQCTNLKSFDHDSTETKGVYLTSLLGQISPDVFELCKSLEIVEITGSSYGTFAIGCNAFACDISLTCFSLIVNKAWRVDNVNIKDEIVIEGGAFQECPLEIFDIETEKVVAIGSDAFFEAGCGESVIDLSEYTSLKSIGNEAFKGSKIMNTEVVLPSSLESIGSFALDCKITKLTIPANVTSIGSCAFGYQPNALKRVFINHTNINKFKQAFSNTTNMFGVSGTVSITSDLFQAFKSANGGKTDKDVENIIKEYLGVPKWTLSK